MWVFFILEPVRLLGACKPGSRARMDSTNGIASYFHLSLITLCYWAGPLGKLYLIDLLSIEDEANWLTLLGSRVNHEKGIRFQIVSCSLFEHIWLNVKIPQVGNLNMRLVQICFRPSGIMRWNVLDRNDKRNLAKRSSTFGTGQACSVSAIASE